MSSKNKFGFAPVDAEPTTPRRERAPGPMGAAVRDAAASLQETTEAKVEQRRRNAEDAKAFRAAQADGLVLVRIPLAEIATDDLPRDRLELENVARSDEMDELKASIRERGQKEPIEVYTGPDGRYQLKKGWRRLTALSQLYEEFGDEEFATAIARVEAGQGDRIARYIDMVEENVVREDLTFAEMAQVAIAAAEDPTVEENDPSALVLKLYGSLHKTKRSYIRAFVFLLGVLGDRLRWPKAVPRNLGVDVSRALRKPEQAESLGAKLVECASPEEQEKVLAAFLKSDGSEGQGAKKVSEPRQKFEFHMGDTKVTARMGECRIVSQRNFASVSQERLEEAVKAFEDALNGGPRARQL